MIKNRESAARSRARRQAYTNELEIKVYHLEEENERLRKTEVNDINRDSFRFRVYLANATPSSLLFITMAKPSSLSVSFFRSCRWLLSWMAPFGIVRKVELKILFLNPSYLSKCNFQSDPELFSYPFLYVLSAPFFAEL
ncbi:hypothetical protein NC651_034872 [Populus alba x Populus x berolinensis]|nr:hypothetical protein NC651_034872 [Populus alba x Populus x berolinensis]